jgi:hypothetical protein
MSPVCTTGGPPLAVGIDCQYIPRYYRDWFEEDGREDDPLCTEDENHSKGEPPIELEGCNMFWKRRKRSIELEIYDPRNGVEWRIRDWSSLENESLVLWVPGIRFLRDSNFLKRLLRVVEANEANVSVCGLGRKALDRVEQCLDLECHRAERQLRALRVKQQDLDRVTDCMVHLDQGWYWTFSGYTEQMLQEVSKIEFRPFDEDADVLANWRLFKYMMWCNYDMSEWAFYCSDKSKFDEVISLVREQVASLNRT